MLTKFSKFLKENKHCYLFIYSFVYLIFFKLIEIKSAVHYHNMHHPLDDKIPFNEFFVIPYFLWFFYIGYVLIKLCIRSKTDFIKAFVYIFGGMTIGLIIFLIYPTAQNLRPISLPHKNHLIGIVHFLHKIDTPTNVCPSLHVYDSIGACIAVLLSKKNPALQDSSPAVGRIGRQLPIHRSAIPRRDFYLTGNFGEITCQTKNIFSLGEKYIAITLTVSICLSTLFLKQHSVIDVFWGIIMGIFMYFIVYIPDYNKIFKRH